MRVTDQRKSPKCVITYRYNCYYYYYYYYHQFIIIVTHCRHDDHNVDDHLKGYISLCMQMRATHKCGLESLLGRLQDVTHHLYDIDKTHNVNERYPRR